MRNNHIIPKLKILMMAIIALTAVRGVFADLTWQSGTRNWGDCFWGADCISIAETSPEGDTSGGGSGTSFSDSSKCEVYSKMFNACYTLDYGLNACIRGCLPGEECQNLKCIPKTGIMQSQQPGIAEKGFWQKTKEFIKGLFETAPPENQQPLKAFKEDVQKESLTSAVSHNPAVAIAIFLIIILIVAFIQFGNALFVMPNFWIIAAIAAIASWIIIKYRILG